MRSMLREIGLKVGHEKPEEDGVVGFQHLIRGHQWQKQAIEMAGDRRIVRLMQVRHPVPAITSMAAMYARGDWPPFAGGMKMSRFCRMDGQDTWVGRAMKLYYHLNHSGLLMDCWRLIYHVEALEGVWSQIMKMLDMDKTPMPDLPKDTNTHKDKGKYPDLSWSNIYGAYPAYGHHIATIATELGYGSLADYRKEDTIDNL